MPKNPHIKLGQRIKHVMGMTNELQKTIAKKAGCQPTEISRWQRGEVAPTYNKLVAIGRALKLDGDEMSWLFDGKGEMPSYPGYPKKGIELTQREKSIIGKQNLKQSQLDNNTSLDEENDPVLLNNLVSALKENSINQKKIIELLEENATLKDVIMQEKPSAQLRSKKSKTAI